MTSGFSSQPRGGGPARVEVYMRHKDDSLRLTGQDLASTFSETTCASRYPPVLTVDQAAALMQVPKQTIYNWSHRGLLRGCYRKVGKHLRFFRDKFLLKMFNEEFQVNGK